MGELGWGGWGEEVGGGGKVVVLAGEDGAVESRGGEIGRVGEGFVDFRWGDEGVGVGVGGGWGCHCGFDSERERPVS